MKHTHNLQVKLIGRSKEAFVISKTCKFDFKWTFSAIQ